MIKHQKERKKYKWNIVPRFVCGLYKWVLYFLKMWADSAYYLFYLGRFGKYHERGYANVWLSRHAQENFIFYNWHNPGIFAHNQVTPSSLSTSYNYTSLGKNAFHNFLKHNAMIYLTWAFFFLDILLKSVVHTRGTFSPRYFCFPFIFLKGKNAITQCTNTNSFRLWLVTVLEHLPSIPEAMGSIPCTAKIKQIYNTYVLKGILK